MTTHQHTTDSALLRGEMRQLLAGFTGRIGAAVLCLLVAKLATVAVPLLLKRIIDAFAQPAALAQLPLYLLAGYALVRFLATLFNALRDLLFARVTLRTVAFYAHKTFVHLHTLTPAFHARRQIGALLSGIDRGSNDIAYLLGVALFTLVPSLIEIGLVLAVMLGRYSAWFSLIIALTFLAHAGFAERGSHADLLRSKGLYARLWMLQQRMDRQQQWEREPRKEKP